MAFRPTLFAAVGTVPLAAAVWLAGGDSEPESAGPISHGTTVEQLVERLGSSNRADRLAAEQELVRRGPDTLDSLPDDVTDQAARDALSRVQARLRSLRAEAATRPQLLTLRGSGPAGDVLKNEVALTPEQAARPVVLAHENQPFWSVMDDVARQIGGWPGDVDADGRLTFRDRTADDDPKRIAYAGSFRIAAGPVAMKTTAAGGRLLLRLPVEVRAEPKPAFRPLFITCTAKSCTLTAWDGKSLAQFSPDAKYEFPVGGPGDPVGMTLDYASETDPVWPLWLAGSLRATIAAGEERFSFPLDGKPHEERRGGVSARLRRSDRHSGSAEVELAVVYDRGGPAFESYRTWVYHNDAKLEAVLTENGSRTSVLIDHEPGFDTLAQVDGGVALRYRFEGIPDDATDLSFHYVAPTKIVVAPIQFRIGELVPRPEPVNAGTDAGP